MVSLKAVHDQLFISHDGVSNDDKLLFWYELNQSNILDLSYDSYPDFNFNDLKDRDCLSQFRFQKHDLPLLAVMEIPDQWSAIKEAPVFDWNLCYMKHAKQLYD